MITKTRVKLDTCGCKIEFAYDYVDVKNSDEHTLVSKTLIQACEFHADADTAHSENVKKNEGIGKVAEILSIEKDAVNWSIDKNTRDINLTVTQEDIKDKQGLVETELAKIDDKLKIKING